MSRLNLSEDEDFPGQNALWWSNMRRSMKGKKGQQALLDLRAALLEMPHKRLIQSSLVKDGDVCTNGALVVKRRAEREDKTPDAVIAEMDAERRLWDGCVCYHARMQHADLSGACAMCVKRREADEEFHAPNPVPWNVRPDCQAFSFQPDYDDDDPADDTLGWTERVGVPKNVAWRLMYLNDEELDRETPEGRYVRVLAWVERQIANPGFSEGWY